MKIYKGFANYIEKKLSVFEEFEKTEKGLTDKLKDINDFSSEAFSKIAISPEVKKYFLLKEIINDEAKGVYRTEKSKFYIQMTDLKNEYPILMAGCIEPNKLNSQLAMFEEIYSALQKDKSCWLMGESTERISMNDDVGCSRHFSTKDIIKSENIKNLKSIDMDIAPRSNYDHSTYCMFISSDGINPITDFCKRFPMKFTAVLAKSDKADMCLDTDRSREDWSNVVSYTTRISLKTTPKEEIVNIAKIADKYL
jgi:hypothetical protein